MSNLNNGSLGNIVISFDDVLVNTAPYIYSIIKKNWNIFKYVFNDPGILDERKICMRTDKNIDQWLIKKNLKDSYANNTEFRSKILFSLYNLVYSSNLYEDLQPTKLALKILTGRIIENERIKKIYIVDNYITNEDKEYKEIFIKKFFNNSKIEMVFVPFWENKVDTIVKLNWTLLIDDDLNVIYDIINREDFDISDKEFLIPEMGYNQSVDRDKMGYIILHNSSLTYYTNTGTLNIK